MTGTKQITPETYIRNLPFSAHRYLSANLDIDDRWKTFVRYVPKRLDCFDSDFQERYTLMQVKMFEDRSRKTSGSATQCILTDWGTQNAKVKHLMKVFIQSKLYAMADYLSVNLMNMGKVPREENWKSPISSEGLKAGEAAIPKPIGEKGRNTDSDINKEKLYRPKMEHCEVESVQMKPPHPKNAERLFRDPHGEIIDRMESYESGIPSAELLAANNGLSAASSLDNDQQNISKISTLKVQDSTCTVSTSQESSQHDDTSDKSTDYNGGSSQIWPYSALRHYTNNFNKKDISNGGNIIGSGGFGQVFLGVLPNGHKIAIKQLNLKTDDDALMEKQFETELKSLSTYRHENIVLLLGYSTDGPQKCLIYEYMPNGSLEDRLGCYKGTPPLSWKLRLEIVHGTAKGIAYLNELKVVHRDIKSANVLLDENFKPKVGDFATIRQAPSGNGLTISETCQVIGTSAYMPPEAVRSFDVSAKLDSFAFGVVLLEVLTGLPPHDPNREEADLISHVQENCDGDIESLLDQSAGDWDVKVANALYDISQKCHVIRKKSRALVSDVLPEIEKLL